MNNNELAGMINNLLHGDKSQIFDDGLVKSRYSVIENLLVTVHTDSLTGELIYHDSKKFSSHELALNKFDELVNFNILVDRMIKGELPWSALEDII